MPTGYIFIEGLGNSGLPQSLGSYSIYVGFGQWYDLQSETILEKLYYTSEITVRSILVDSALGLGVGSSDWQYASMAGSTTTCITGKGTNGYRLSAKYTFATDTIVAGTNFVQNTAYSTATGSNTIGYYVGGIFSGSGLYANNVEKYTYSTDTVTAGTSLSRLVANAAACGTGTVGIFSGGSNSTVVQTTTVNKYTYSGDTIAAGTSLATARQTHCATGYSVYGIMMGGYDSGSNVLATTEKYTYSGDSRTAGTTVSPSIGGPTGTSTGAGNTSYGIVTGPGAHIKYAYSGEYVTIFGGMSGGYGYPINAYLVGQGSCPAGYS